jgi:hypothetical protein
VKFCPAPGVLEVPGCRHSSRHPGSRLNLTPDDVADKMTTKRHCR